MGGGGMSERWWAWNAEALLDGWPHERDESGFCKNCGATGREPHYKLVLKPIEEAE